MTTKAQRIAVLNEKVSAEKARILHILNESDYYDITLDPAIEAYLDVYEIYQMKYMEWKEKGFPSTKKYKNKASATNDMKHPLAQQVEVWTDKRMKALDILGLTNKKKQGKIVGGKSSVRDEQIHRPDGAVHDELAAHRNKWRKKAGDAG